MLNDIKKIMGFNNTEFDSIIGMYIKSGKQDLIEMGIASYRVNESDPLIYSAIVSYVLSLLDVPNAELYANAIVSFSCPIPVCSFASVAFCKIPLSPESIEILIPS